METTILAIAVICLGVATLVLSIRLAKAESKISLLLTLPHDVFKMILANENWNDFRNAMCTLIRAAHANSEKLKK